MDRCNNVNVKINDGGKKKKKKREKNDQTIVGNEDKERVVTFRKRAARDGVRGILSKCASRPETIVNRRSPRHRAAQKRAKESRAARRDSPLHRGRAMPTLEAQRNGLKRIRDR